MSLAGVLETVELDLYDWRMRGAVTSPPDVNPDIVLVTIDDQTLRDFPALGRWPWPRVAHTFILDFLKRAPARVVAYDVGFFEPDVSGAMIGGTRWEGAESDAAFVESVKALGNVIMLGDAVYGGVDEQLHKPAVWPDPGYRVRQAAEPRPMILAPFQSLTDASAAIGHNFLTIDPNGTARRMPPFVQVGDRSVPSLGVAAALKGGGFRPDEVSVDGESIVVRDRRIPLVTTPVRDIGSNETRDQRSMLINYRAPAVLPDGRHPYATYEARYLMRSEEQLQNGEKPELDPSVFKDKIVFVGTSASGTHDVFQTPFGEGTMPGIQLHASVADSILANRFIRPAGDRWRVAAVIAGGIAVGLLAAFLPFAAAAPGAVFVMCLWAVYALQAFKGGVWVNMSEPMSAMALALFAGTAYQYFVEGSQKRVVKKLFGRYVSKDVYDQLIAHPEIAELGGKRRDMSVLFSDIRGFTSVTEKGNPEELVAQLNEYFSRMVAIVFRHKGTVDKFVGDMVMALFGAPLDDPDHAEHAVAAAVDMVHELADLNRKWAAEGRATLDIGVGINSGDMIAGNIGSSSIMSYTVIGDNVNLGSRLESANKDYKTRIIISDATRGRLTGTYDLRPLGDVIVKGKTRPVAIFEVWVPSPLPEQTV